MPPEPVWFAGREAVGAFVAGRIFAGVGPLHLVLTSANTQPAVAAYTRDADGVRRAHALQVLTLRDGAVARIVAFREPSVLARFGLAPTLDGIGAPASP
jgi:RNA polymerase sigma-70 factor (ECF subfamily)